MAQEYVTVQVSPHEPAHRQARAANGRRVLSVCLAIIAVIAIAGGIVTAWPDQTTEPLPVPTERAVRGPDAAVATVRVFEEWLNRKELVACLHSRGFAYEPRIVDNRDSLEVVAQYLEVEPTTAHPDAPLPMLRQPDLYLGRGGEIVEQGLEIGASCELPRNALDDATPEAIAAVVATARDDEEFLVTVAEQVWIDRNPALVTHHVSLLRYDRSGSGAGGAPSAAWSEPLEVVTAAAQELVVWVPVVTDERELFAHSVGLLGSGAAVVIRVGEADVALGSGTYMTRGDVIRCGPMTISAAVKAPWGRDEDLADVMFALGPACTALIGAGFVEAETLAEVYWD